MVGCSNPSLYRSTSLKQGSDSSTAKRSALGVSFTGYYKRMFRITVDVAR